MKKKSTKWDNRYLARGIVCILCFLLTIRALSIEAQCSSHGGWSSDEERKEAGYYLQDETDELIEKWKKEFESQGALVFSSVKERDEYLKSIGKSSGTTNTQKQEQPVVKKCEHVYTTDITIEATCAADGEMTFTCKNCGDAYKEKVPKTDTHTYESSVTKEATCTEEGITTFTCSVCSDEYTESIAATGHSHESNVTKTATCEEPGTLTYVCKFCDDTYTEEINPLGHQKEERITKEAKTFINGEKETYCTSCDKVLGTDVIESTYPILYLYIIIGATAVVLVAAIIIVLSMKRKKDKKQESV